MIESIKNCKIFSALNDDELNVLSEITEKLTIKKDEYAFKEGDPGDSLLIIQNGSLRVTKKKYDGDEQSLIIAGQNVLLGEMTFLNPGNRTASGMAKDDMEILRIPFDELHKLIDSNRDISVKFYKKLAELLAKRISRLTSEFTAMTAEYADELRTCRP